MGMGARLPSRGSQGAGFRQEAPRPPGAGSAAAGQGETRLSRVPNKTRLSQLKSLHVEWGAVASSVFKSCLACSFHGGQGTGPPRGFAPGLHRADAVQPGR